MKKTIIIILIVLSIFASLFLFLHNKDEPININTASVEALEALPGVGEVLAKRIISERPFNDLYELDRVKGIGPKTIEKIVDKAVAE